MQPQNRRVSELAHMLRYASEAIVTWHLATPTDRVDERWRHT